MTKHSALVFFFPICELLDLKQLECCTAVQVKYFHVSNIQGPPLAKCLKISCYMQLLTTLSNNCTEANSGPNLDNVSSLILSHNICIKSEIQEQEICCGT